MKAAAFEYQRVDSIAAACTALDEYGSEAKLIAGGQSLVPMMAMRLLRPTWLVDINPITALKTLEERPEGIAIGAGFRQCEIERNRVLLERVPLLGRALAFVGHVQTRNRGTIGGSMVHADPSAELPLAALVLDATMMLQDTKGTTPVKAQAFFTGPMSTAIEPTQCLTAIHIPVWSGTHQGSAFDEVAIRHGDFAIVAAAAQVQLDDSGKCLRAAIGIGGAGPTPLAFPEIAVRLIGGTLDDPAIDAAAAAVAAACDPGSDLHASVAYRRHLARVLMGRVLRAARIEAVQ